MRKVTARNGVGSNQYQTRPGVPVPPGRGREIAAALSEPVEDLTRVWSRGVPANHAIDVSSDGTAVFVSCDGCPRCRHRLKQFRGMVTEGHEQWVAAGLVERHLYRGVDISQIAAKWHDGCSGDCAVNRAGSIPDQVEVAEWAAVGVASHRVAVQLKEKGWTPRAVHDTGLADPQEWLIEGDDPVEALRWEALGLMSRMNAETWMNRGFNPDSASAWIEASEMRPTLATLWVSHFTDPVEAAAWDSTFDVIGDSERFRGERAKTAGALAKAGINHADLPKWMAVRQTDAAELADAAAACDGNLTVLGLMKGRGPSQINLTMDACGRDPTVVAAWHALRIVDAKVIAACNELGVTPTDVAAARARGSYASTVACSGGDHQVKVTWKDGRARWTMPDHDRELDAVAAAFGGDERPCQKLVRSSKELWGGGSGAVDPGAASRSVVTGDHREAAKITRTE